MATLGCGSDSVGDNQPTGGMGSIRSSSVIEWRDCGRIQCAEVMVPLDRDDPDGEKIPIALNRIPVEPGGLNFGVLMFNPGGPGQPGKPLIANSVDVLETFPFDIIGFDPRGTGDSQPLQCVGSSNLNDVLADNDVAAYIAALQEESEICRQEAGDLFDHMSTNAMVADIEQLRIALEVERINFYGISYGTRLGAVYAQTYPQRVRALVLDSPVAPSADLQALILSQFDGVVAAHEALLDGCSEGTLDCPEESEPLFEQMLALAETNGARAEFIARWGLLLASPPGRDILTQALTEVSAGSLEMVDGMETVMDGVSSPEMSPLGEAFNGIVNVTVNCADDPSMPASLEQAEALVADYAERSTVFASRGLAAVTCSGWQVPSDPAPDVNFSPSTPPLIVAGTQDPLTPMPLAEALAEAIEGSVLLRSEHYGHGILSFGGLCVAEPLGRYLGQLRLPSPGIVCPGP